MINPKPRANHVLDELSLVNLIIICLQYATLFERQKPSVVHIKVFFARTESIFSKKAAPSPYSFINTETAISISYELNITYILSSLLYHLTDPHVSLE